MNKSVERVVLAYSGGLDTSVIVKWLIEQYDCEVVCYCGDLGQGVEELDGLEKKARETGASELVVEDLTPIFVRDYVWPALRAGAIYEGRYLLGTALGRPLLALRQVQTARYFGADALAHGCTGKGNDQLRFELTYRATAPDLHVIAPWREWDLQGREDCINYAKAHAIPVTASKEKIYSRDRNLWHISHEGGELEDPWNAPPRSVYMLTADPVDAPDAPEEVTLSFESGFPVALNDEALPPHELLSRLNEIAGRHGVGRIDIVENRVVGLKSRGVYETPGGTVLMTALRDLESITLGGMALRERMRAGEAYADLCYRGLWFTPTREALEAMVDRLMQPVNGDVRVELYKGRALAVARRSHTSLYSSGLVSFDEAGGYDQKDAAGFIRLLGLPLEAELLRSASMAAPNPEADVKTEDDNRDDTGGSDDPGKKPKSKSQSAA
ncbi:MAG: argininosuccinate synthase [Myxococcota bacterium]